MISIQRVDILKSDTCLTYALKRIGLQDLYPLDYEELVFGDRFKSFVYNPLIVEVGDLLMWDKNADQEDIAMSIDRDLKVTSRKVYVRYHVAVYEGEGYISDIKRIGHYPCIRLSLLSDVYPNKLIRYCAK